MTENKQQKPNKNFSAQTAAAFGIAFELGFIIALPIVILGLVGKWLDQKYASGYFVYLAIALAITITSIWIYGRFKFFLEKFEKATPKKSAATTEKINQEPAAKELNK